MPIKPTNPSDEGAVSDGRLLERHLRGDVGAFPELTRRHANAVYGYLVRCGLEMSDREDIFQDIFWKVHQAAPRFDTSRVFKAWLFTIAVNTVRSHMRRRRVRSIVNISEHLDRERAVTPGPERLTQARRTARWLETAITTLPTKQREVLTLCCVEQLPQREVAAALDMPVNTVKTHLRRARLALATALAQRSD